MFTLLTLEQRIPQDHPLRAIRGMVDRALAALSGGSDALCSKVGRSSIGPERPLRAPVLQVLLTVRSERRLLERLYYNLLSRWFVGWPIDEPVWNASTYSKNRDRSLVDDVAQRSFEQVLVEARRRHLLSNEQFTVDGTRTNAWAGQQSFRPKDGSDDPPTDAGRNAEVDFRGQPRSNETHAWTTDPDARLFRKSRQTGAVLCYMGPVQMENRNGLAVSGRRSQATGRAERKAAVSMVAEVPGVSPITLGANKVHDTADFVADLREIGVTPHVAQDDRGRSSVVDERTTRHPGYDTSQRKRRRVEEIFGWIKTVGCLRKTRHRGHQRVGWVHLFTLAVHNLVRIERLVRATG